MRAIFSSKIQNLKELIEKTKDARMGGWIGQAYQIEKEVILSETEYKVFTENFILDQPWITSENGGGDTQGIKCIRISTSRAEKGVLVNSEGYTYPRYIALEQ